MLAEVRGNNPIGLNIDLRDDVASDMDLLNRLVRDTGVFPSLFFIHHVGRMLEELIALGTRGVVAPSGSSSGKLRKGVLASVTSALANIKAKVANGKERPLIIINGMSAVFCTEYEDTASDLFAWAKHVSARGLAKVVIACDVTTAETQAEKSSAFQPVVLTDAKHQKTVDFLRVALSSSTSQKEVNHIEQVASLVGGRLSDILGITKRVAAGASLDEACTDILDSAVKFLREHALGLGKKRDLGWTQAQIW